MVLSFKMAFLGCLTVIALHGCMDGDHLSRTKSPEHQPGGKDDFAENQPEWPWSVYGQVTDENGRGLAGVTVGASCGWGTLMPTGSATTDSQGHYRMPFGPGVVYREGKDIAVVKTVQQTGIQAAVISPRKPGWYEVNLARQGDLRMSGESSTSSEDSHSSSERVILPNQPRRVDFILSPAAKASGRVIKPSGAAVEQTRFYVTGNDLPPAASVLAQIVTDENGRFALHDIPLKTFWFTPADQFKDLRSNGLSFDHPGSYEILVVMDQEKGQLKAEMASRPVRAD